MYTVVKSLTHTQKKNIDIFQTKAHHERTSGLLKPVMWIHIQNAEISELIDIPCG